MAAIEFNWIEESLTEDDKRLIEAYAEVGRPVDDLAYTEEFDRLVSLANELPVDTEPDNELKQKAFRRLLNLRKRGRLPRLVHSASND